MGKVIAFRKESNLYKNLSRLIEIAGSLEGLAMYEAMMEAALLYPNFIAMMEAGERRGGFLPGETIWIRKQIENKREMLQKRH